MPAQLDRWSDRLTEPGKRAIQGSRSSNIIVEGDDIYSYGRHFPLAYVQRATPDSPAHLVLLNGDRYSVSTAQHQAKVREAVRVAGVPSIIVPFSALRAAGIFDLDSIRALEVLPDRWEYMPDRTTDSELITRRTWDIAVSNVRDNGDGTWTYTPRVHRLGESVFSAVSHGRRRRYLSGFDRNENRPLYFLAELPRCTASTVDEALEALKPDAVKLAEGMGRTVARQGDIFAVPMPSLTRADLRRMGATFARRSDARPAGHGTIRRDVAARLSLLGTAHVATEVATLPDGTQYARGCMYHDPAVLGQWRERDHARCKLGSGEWHVIARNTVPVRKGRRATSLN